MKRMVLIPEEKLIRYEKQLDGPTNEQEGGSTFSWGIRPPHSLSWWKLSWT